MSGIAFAALQALPVLAVFGALYFLYLRPIRQSHRKHKKMLGNLEAGNPVVLDTGIYGRVAGFSESGAVLLSLTDNIVVPLRRESIAEVVSEEDFASARAFKE